MNSLASIALFSWVPLVLLMFMCMKPRRAVTVAFLLAWLFLPNATFKFIEGVPLFTKMTATCLGVLLGATLFDHRRLLAIQVSWIDIPMIAWCICPLFSSLSNGLGLYDGISAALYQTIDWGLAYFIGRVYYSNLDGLLELAIAVMIGGIIYVPLCLYEMRMSPQLHRMIYGAFQHDFGQTIRYDGWRPMVFMQHGLAVGMWMAMATLIGFWLWISGIVSKFLRISIQWYVLVLFLTCLYCRSTGAVILLLGGIVILLAARFLRTPLILIAVLAIPPVYMTLRSTDMWDGTNLVELTSKYLGYDRGQSIKFRFDNEDLLAEKALQQPMFGWGRWKRASVFDEDGREITVTDGLWIIALGNTGIFGLIAISAVHILPGLVLIGKIRAGKWNLPPYASPAVFVVMLALFMIDNLFNAMINPLFVMAAGGVCGCLLKNRVLQLATVPAVPVAAPAIATVVFQSWNSPDNAHHPKSSRFRRALLLRSR